MPSEKRTPYEEHLNKEILRVGKTARMDHELAKYGKPVRGGMAWSTADLHRFFEAQGVYKKMPTLKKK